MSNKLPQSATIERKATHLFFFFYPQVKECQTALKQTLQKKKKLKLTSEDATLSHELVSNMCISMSELKPTTEKYCICLL